jgi:hypothetical protein
MFSALKIITNEIYLKKLWRFKIEGSNTQKKTLNATKANSQTPTKFLVCCFVVVRV